MNQLQNNLIFFFKKIRKKSNDEKFESQLPDRRPDGNYTVLPASVRDVLTTIFVCFELVDDLG